MTLTEFIEQLPRDGWYLMDKRYLRRLKVKEMEYSLCPICHLNYCKTGVMRDNSTYRIAVQELGMEAYLGDTIACAADKRLVDNPSIADCRKLLLQHCGLADEDNNS